jgi:hypothetical protein
MLRRWFLVAAISVLGLLNVAAFCQGSGAWKVFSFEGGFTVIDSNSGVFETRDDGDTWSRVAGLPRPRTDQTDGLCLSDGDCFRIRADRLGIEHQAGDRWDTVWAYPEQRIDYLNRQLPGSCGEGYGSVGLEGLVPGPDGSRWAMLVSAGADGLMGVTHDGTWVQGIFGEPAQLDAAVSDLYLVPEILLVGFAVAAGVVIFGFYDATPVSRFVLVAAIALSFMVSVWGFHRQFPWESPMITFVLSLVPPSLLVVWCRDRWCEMREMLVGGFIAAAVGLVWIAVSLGGDDLARGVIVWGLSLFPLVGAGLIARGLVARPDRWRRGWLAATLVIGGGGLVALMAYQWWAVGVVESKPVADLVAGVVVAAAYTVAWLLWRGLVTLPVEPEAQGAR